MPETAVEALLRDLNSLPECTALSYLKGGVIWQVVKGKGPWWFVLLQGRVLGTNELIREAEEGSIKVSAVPTPPQLSQDLVLAIWGRPPGAPWTVEMLDALPLNTLIGLDNEVQEPAWVRGTHAHGEYQWWSLLDGFGHTSASILDQLDGRPEILALPPLARVVRAD